MLIRTLGEDAELRLAELRHAPALFELVGANRDRLYWFSPDFSADDMAQRIREGLARLAEGTGFDALIVHHGAIVGFTGLFHVRPRVGSGELGYWIDRNAEGRGLVRRAAAAMVDYAFAELSLRRVEIRCAASNTRSRAIPERLGFSLEGTLRRAEPVGDAWEDMLVFGLLSEEWRARSGEARTDG